MRKFGHQRGSCIVSQCRYALSRHSSMNFGSPFFAEIVRMSSSLRPLGTVSASMSVMKPYLYSRLASSSIVLVAVVIVLFDSFFSNLVSVLKPQSSLLRQRQGNQRCRRLENRLRQPRAQ